MPQQQQQQPTLLVVDDESEVTEVLRDYLEARGFTVRTAASAADALRTLGSTAVDCALLDVMLPDRSGFDVGRELRASHEVPILFLTALDDDANKLRGLGLGDDYIVKNASPAEIVARVEAVLRRARPLRRVVRYGQLSINLDAREARVQGQAVKLTRREFDLLQLLATHPRQVLTHQRIVAELWDGYADVSTLWSYTRRLREKLEHDPASPRHIVTVWGVGYRFDP